METINVKSVMLGRAFQVAGMFAAKKSIPNLFRVRLELVPGALVIVASDGVALCSCKIPVSHQVADEHIAEIRVSDAKLLSKGLQSGVQNDEELILDFVDSKSLTLIGSHVSSSVELLDPRMPKAWRDVMQKEQLPGGVTWSKVLLDPKYLEKATRSVKVFTGGSNMYIEMGDKIHPVWVRSDIDGSEIDIVIMPQRS